MPKPSLLFPTVLLGCPLVPLEIALGVVDKFSASDAHNLSMLRAPFWR